MKTTSFLAALIVLGTSAFAKEPGSTRIAVINQGEASSYKVIYKGESVGKVKLTIFNAEGEIVFEDTKEVSGFIRKVNFGKMNPGTYTIQVADKDGKQSQTVVYGTGSAVGSAVKISKLKDTDKYLVALTNDSPEKVQLKIFDGSSNLVHSRELSIDRSLKVVYYLKNVDGVPTFQITDRNGVVRTITDY